MNFRRILQLLPDKPYIQLMYYYHFHKFANLKNPQTFNEKLQWLKLYDRNPEYTIMVDKIAAKQYVTEKIGEEFIIPTLGVWNKPDEINFDTLPDQFVLKWNHDSHSVVICEAKSDLDVISTINKLRHGEKINGFWYGREWPYKNVQPKILAEKYLVQDGIDANYGKMLIDYKFMCFNGEVKCCFTCTGRSSKEGLKVTFYDTKWNILPFERSHPKEMVPCKRPYSYDKMVWAAELLSQNIPFARIDFYEVGKVPYFGEITLYPGSGMEAFQPEEWDRTLGEWIVLPKKLEK